MRLRKFLDKIWTEEGISIETVFQSIPILCSPFISVSLFLNDKYWKWTGKEYVEMSVLSLSSRGWKIISNTSLDCLAKQNNLNSVLNWSWQKSNKKSLRNCDKPDQTAWTRCLRFRLEFFYLSKKSWKGGISNKNICAAIFISSDMIRPFIYRNWNILFVSHNVKLQFGFQFGIWNCIYNQFHSHLHIVY